MQGTGGLDSTSPSPTSIFDEDCHDYQDNEGSKDIFGAEEMENLL